MKPRSLFYALLGCLLLLGAWELLGRTGALGKTLPALSQVLGVYLDAPKRALLLRSAAATLGSAAIGFAVGACAGAAVAVLAHLVPILRGGLDRMAVLVNALPVIALGPILIITAGREDTPSARAPVPVFFLPYISTGLGLRAASHRLDLMFTTLGATRWQRLVKLEMVAGLPSILSS